MATVEYARTGALEAGVPTELSSVSSAPSSAGASDSEEEEPTGEPTEQDHAAVHPNLRRAAEKAASRAASRKGSETVAPVAHASPSLQPTEKRDSYRDSFRHSFAIVDHPLAQQHTTPPRNGAHGHQSTISEDEPRSSEPSPADEVDAAQEATVRTNTSPDESLSAIIKQALASPGKDEQRGEVKNGTTSDEKAVNGESNDTQAPPSVAMPTTAISMSRMVKLLHHFVFLYSKNPSTHRASPRSMVIQQRVTSLAKLDYHVSVIANDSTRNGAARDNAAGAKDPAAAAANAGDAAFEYCSSYPLELLIFENEKAGPFGVGQGDVADGDRSTSASSAHTLQSRVNDSAVLKPLFRLSRFSRVHGRFVIPVILVRNKNICRSSTLAIQAEAILNNIHSATKQMVSSFWDTLSGLGGSSTSSANGTTSAASTSSSVQVGLEGQRAHDVQLLLHTATSYIEDLMVEHRKKKMGVALTSSEKNEQWRYAQMKLNALPYPGCEFFTEYKQNQHSGLNLFFNWSQSFISSDLLLSNPSPMIPDEMLSCNGRLGAPMAGRDSLAQIEEDQAPWFEFQHDTATHRAARKKEAADAAVDAQPNLSLSPPVSAVAADLLHQLLSHSATGAAAAALSTNGSDEAAVPAVASAEPTESLVAADSTTISTSTTAAVASSFAPSFASVVASSAASAAATTSSSLLSSSPAAASSGMVSASLATPAPSQITSFSLYKSWDVVTLTKNYLLILLAHVADEGPNTGLLVHCISGWDRTPLFISLLRLSLWADGEVHRSLNAMQILYFTVAYDWMLHGHMLHNRLEKGEDVFYFCFDFLQYITNTKFALSTAADMRLRKRVVEAELHVERSASPTPVPTAVSSPAQKPRRTSALTSALQQQAQADGSTAPPPPRKSSSDGSKTRTEDDDRVARLGNGSSSCSPSTSLQSMPPASSSYTASKPLPSLASFIIDDQSHTSDQQARTVATPNSVTTPNGEVESSPPAYVPSTSVPIPKRKTSTHGESAPAVEHDVTAASQLSAVSHSPSVSATSGAVAGSQMSRATSWTMIAGSALANASASAAVTAPAGLSLAGTPPMHPNGKLHAPAPKAAAAAAPPASNGTSSSSSSAPSSSPHSDTSASACSMRRCERLLEVRSLFLSAYHTVLPSTPPAANSPHSKHTAHAASMRAAAVQRRASTFTAVMESAPVIVSEHASPSGTTAPASASSPRVAPVAAPIARAASAGWFSS